jgi:hypothetical protein
MVAKTRLHGLADSLLVMFGRSTESEDLPSDLVVPSAHSNLVQVFRSLLLACFGLDGWRRTGSDWLTGRGEL